MLRCDSVTKPDYLFVLVLLSAALPYNAADYLCNAETTSAYFIFFIHRSFSETTRPILTKFSGIVYSGVV